MKKLEKSKITAQQIMSSPVRTIPKDITIQNAYSLMIRYDYNSFVVATENVVEGIISRRDIEKAFHHELKNSNIKDFIYSRLFIIKPETTFTEIESLMPENNLGKFIVVHDNKLVGIVTRTDILQVIYNKHSKKENISIESNDLSSEINLHTKMKEHFNFKTFEFLEKIGKVADDIECKAYIVGGGVRDLIIDNRKDVDLDIVIEGDTIKFAKEVAKIYDATVITHDKYGTAKIKLENSLNDLDDEQIIDIATARTEFYEYPAANPKVEFSTIRQDLYRRDFTINALAISLNSQSFGEVIDFFNGYDDIHHKKIQILHNLSFVEDPNRIFRAVRLEQKLGFRMDKFTSDMAIIAMTTGKFDYFMNDRIKTELKKILTEKYNVTENIKRLSDLKALNCISPNIDYSKVEIKLKNLSHYIKLLKDSDRKTDEWIFYINILLNEIQDEEKFIHVFNQFRFSKEEEKIIKMFREFPDQLKDINWQQIRNSDIYHFWKKYPIETVISAMSITTDINIKNSIDKYFTKLKDIKLIIDGNYLKSLGIKKGKLLGDILKKVLSAKLNGEVKTFQEEEEFAKKLINNTFVS